VDKLNILAVYPHPADSATEASGTLALHAERGDTITSVICTYGERHHMQWLYDEEKKPEEERDLAIINMTLQQYRDFKKREAERIAEIIGVSELIFLDWTDQEVDFNWDRVAQIREVLMRVRPDIVVTHLPVELGGHEDDHPIVGRIVMSAIGSALHRVRQFDGVEPYRGVKQVFWSFAGGEENNSRNMLAGGIVCDVWIDTTPVIHKKVHAMDQLVSQGYHEGTARWIVEARDARWGMIAGCAYAEPFMRPTGITYDYLPTPERLFRKKYVPTDVPDQRLTAHTVPSGTPPEAYRLFPGDSR
jgi:LmbE family N-acetylglucosaminyl deacetylase